jgi:putative transposase
VKHLDPQLRALVVARLRDKRAEGRLTSGDVRVAASALSVGERTLWRWLAEANAAPEVVTARSSPRRYVLTEADRDAYLDWRGNVAALRRDRLLRGETMPPLRTLQRAFTEQLSPGERAAAVDGVEGRRRHEVYLRWEPVARNARWEADHKELPVLVTPPRGVRPHKPWVTLFIDCYSRLIMGWALSLHPDSATVLAALRRGLVIDADRGPFGGVPRVLVPDNGLEFATAALAKACAALGILLDPTDAYTPHQKGKVERANLTVDQEFLCGLPFYTEGPRGADGHLFGPDAPPMSLELFADRFAGWVIQYNTVRPHSALDGLTPLGRWSDDPTPVREVASEQLRWLLLADVERTINRDGIHFGGHIFIAGDLNGLVGERVQVRYTPHDLRQIEVFRGDQWLCTARPQGQLSREERDAVLEHRRADAAELGRRQRRASRRARAKLAPITAPITDPGQLEDITVVTAVGDGEHRRRTQGERGERDLEQRDRDLQRLARTDLLNLHRDFAYWNPPEPGAAVELDADVPGEPTKPGDPG